MQDGWIFAYGSLMWDPGLPVAEAVPARLTGWHRSFCLRSVRHRGTPERPGLVLGLDAAPGAVCQGMALRVAAPDWEDALAATRERELVTGAYREVLVPLGTTEGRTVSALTYVVRRDHCQYAGGLSLDAQAEIIASAVGQRGSNVTYLANFLDHLGRLGIVDPDFDALRRKVFELVGTLEARDERPWSGPLPALGRDLGAS